ncbi:MAG: 4a-hydroxytetrahydrobiopterin dehydratase [Ignavibacteria bacterium RBG_16_34_14]|nr:MAG: 4a-hydroxytetrahydrobiopterin dehydratase [Ignavibacteria bacterium RBG_16_34_14]
MALLGSNEIMNKLKNVDNWNFDNNQIQSDYQFKDFKEALNFVNKVGDEAEKMNHHPDIFLHSWNKVKITISTHSEGGVTEKDFKLAAIIDKLSK